MTIEAIFAHPRVLAARRAIREASEATLREQLRIVAIPAPTGAETERAHFLQHRFHQLGLERIEIDAAGNVLGCRPGGDRDRPPLLLAAHLDTIFPPGTAVVPRRVGARIHAPGISDNARGLSALLALAAAIHAARLRTTHDLWFIGTTGEEGLGDLRGVRHLLREGSPLRRCAGFIALDGAGCSPIVHAAIGSVRLRIRVRGPGGHAWGDRGTAHPLHALALAITRMQRVRLPGHAPHSINVGRIAGGTSINAIPAAGWMEVDLRSEEQGVLTALEAGVRAIVEGACAEVNAASTRGVLTVEIEPLGTRPSGRLAPDHPLVRGAIAATRAIGAPPELMAASTDANLPLSLGIPAIALGAGGIAGGVHTLEEWFENRDGALGPERALLTLVAAAGVHGKGQSDRAP